MIKRSVLAGLLALALILAACQPSAPQATTAPTQAGSNPPAENPDGAIVIKHEITIGDVIVSTILLALLIYHVLDRLIRR